MKIVMIKIYYVLYFIFIFLILTDMILIYLLYIWVTITINTYININNQDNILNNIKIKMIKATFFIMYDYWKKFL